MATKEVLLSGKVKWAKLFKPESYQSGPPKYSVVLYLDPPSRIVFDGLKLKNHVKSDADGEYITLRREHNPKVFDGRVIADGGPPEIVDTDGNAWDENKLIGNGSEVTMKIAVYDTKMGPGSRIVKIRVENLIEYHPDTSGAVPF